MSAYDAKAAAEANRRLMEQAAEAAVRRVHQIAKPTLKRYNWSRLHSDLLDDNRWSLVAKRASAPLPIVEALVMRLEIHANKSQPRGYVGDFDAEAMAVRWGIEVAMVERIFEHLESSQIGWIDQDQVVSFWNRNPDKVDETAAERMRRMRSRRKGMRQLAALARVGAISEAQRLERETALRNSKDPAEVIASWSGALGRLETVTRNTVTVTPRADQIIKQEAPNDVEQMTSAETADRGSSPIAFADKAKALQWLRGEGEAIVMRRCGVLRSKAGAKIGRWCVTLAQDVTALAEIILAASATNAQGPAFERLVLDQVARRASEMIGGQPQLKFGPERPVQRRDSS